MMIKIHGTRKHSICINHNLWIISIPYIICASVKRKANNASLHLFCNCHRKSKNPMVIRTAPRIYARKNWPAAAILQYKTSLRIAPCVYCIQIWRYTIFFILILFAVCSHICAVDLICHQIQKTYLWDRFKHGTSLAV